MLVRNKSVHCVLKNEAPIEGLYFVRHWSSPRCGTAGVSLSGVQAAQRVLGIKKQAWLWV